VQIEEGTDVDVRDNFGWTALMHAEDGKYEDIVDLLIF